MQIVVNLQLELEHTTLQSQTSRTATPEDIVIDTILVYPMLEQSIHALVHIVTG